MPTARWQSSQKPLFVRTVWVNGLRHAILSADDPLFQCRSPVISNSGGRPSSCNSVSTFTSSSSGSTNNCEDNASCDLENCLVKLQLIFNSNKSPTKPSTSAPSTNRSASSRFCQDVAPCSEGLQDSKENISVAAASMVGHYRRPYLPYFFPSSSEEEREREAVEEDPSFLSDVESLLPDLQLNSLSERVLQWLDLVGKSAGVVDGSEKTAPVPRCGKRNGRGRHSSRYLSTPIPPSLSEVTTGRRYASKRTLQPQRNVDMGGEVTTVTLQPGLETAPVNTSFPDDPLHVTARGLKTVQRKREAFDDVRAVINETVRCASPVKADVCFQSSDPSRTPQQPDLTHSATPSPPLSPLTVVPVKSDDSRPQLHIFMPTLQRDRPSLRYQDADDDVSDCDSYWSETCSQY